MKLPGFFVLVIVFGTSADYIPDLPDDPDLTNFFEQYGSGICKVGVKIRNLKVDFET